MKKMMIFSSLFVLSIALLACQGSITIAKPTLETYIPSMQTQEILFIITPTQAELTQEPFITPTPTKSPSLSETPTPTVLKPEMKTQVYITVDINYIPELSGSLYIGASYFGEHIKIDFDNDRTSYLKLPYGCQIISTRLKAICKVNDLSGIYIYDLLTQQRDFDYPRDVGRWELTSSERILKYFRSEPGGDGILVEVYDFESSTARTLGNFNNRDATLYLPWLSNSGEALVGVDTGLNPWFENDDTWYVMDVKDMKAQPLSVPANIAATDSVEWSPDDTMVALVGFYKDDIDPMVGNLRCKKEVIFYDPNTQEVRFSVQVPAERCFTPIALYQDCVWSPDSSRLAMILDHQDICIIDTHEGSRNCQSITDNFLTEYKVVGLAWSPDSNSIAFTETNGEIRVFSFDTKETYLIANVNDLTQSPIGLDLVWGQK